VGGFCASCPVWRCCVSDVLARTAAQNDHGRIDGLSVNSGLLGPSGSLGLIDHDRHRVSKRTQYFVGHRGSSGSPGLARSPASSLSSVHAPAGAESDTSLTSHPPHPAPLQLSISADLKRAARLVASRTLSATIKSLRRSRAVAESHDSMHGPAHWRNTPSLTVRGRERPRT
jgi:hypothetical protein